MGATVRSAIADFGNSATSGSRGKKATGVESAPGRRVAPWGLTVGSNHFTKPANACYRAAKDATDSNVLKHGHKFGPGKGWVPPLIDVRGFAKCPQFQDGGGRGIPDFLPL
jgi:hypothetical protein